jgi:hypothetical protein
MVLRSRDVEYWWLVERSGASSLRLGLGLAAASS